MTVLPSSVHKEMNYKQEFQLQNIPHPKSPSTFSIPDASLSQPPEIPSIAKKNTPGNIRVGQSMPRGAPALSLHSSEAEVLQQHE